MGGVAEFVVRVVIVSGGGVLQCLYKGVLVGEGCSRVCSHC